MQSFTHHPFKHSGAAAALLSAAPSSSTILTTRKPVLIAAALLSAAPSSSTTLTTRKPVLIANRGVTGNCNLGFVNLKLRIRIGSADPQRVRVAVVMQWLLMRRGGVKASRPCMACRSRSGTAGEEEYEESPPQNVVLKAISEVSKSEGRVGKTTNMVIGGTVKKDAESEWDAIDQKVNVYPMARDFTAIGTGGDEFVQAMVQAVESVTECPVPKVTKKLSSQGKYVSVKIGGIMVTSSEQVRAVYDAMRKDNRMKYFL